MLDSPTVGFFAYFVLMREKLLGFYLLEGKS